MGSLVLRIKKAYLKVKTKVYREGSGTGSDSNDEPYRTDIYSVFSGVQVTPRLCPGFSMTSTSLELKFESVCVVTSTGLEWGFRASQKLLKYGRFLICENSRIFNNFSLNFVNL